MPDPTRRTVVCGLLAGLVAPVSLAACSSGTPAAGSPPAGSAGNTPAGGGSSGTALAKLADVPVGSGAIVTGPSGKVLLVRPSENEVKGLDPVCPHAGVTVAKPEGGTITCPGHGSVFDAKTGAMKKGPATSGLTPIPVKISGDSIVTA
ncbi:nitrite reductase/ring-hydroxylating ferredoxin subunit [Kibdelosporangium banguiense]|uniref:Nitrite reductase/ring-hydroxylating ferredoxin subunit n=1 Tax=Kibdelosporangium banguiense TaxID=1365924 RepID=A0ABS4U1L9_9PSEU|nr:Rieske (2Fe-2S) protein [Kibdelosporangium banguiense]MBP2330086.1 nitrite reductase/ring-hydroxylating ferredoxin subunit [Kibdelosporangium banguiense]